MSSPYTAKHWQLASLFVFLFIVWVLWSGVYKPLLLGLGLFSCFLSVWLAKRLGFFHHGIQLKSLFRLPALWGWLLIQVIKSSIHVARIVLTPSLPIRPKLVEITTAEQSETGKVILGNSITLSPGTVTIDVHGERLLVHCLTNESTADLGSGELELRIARLELG